MTKRRKTKEGSRTIHPEWCGFSYGSGSAIWNNSGDTAYLRDSGGNLIDTYSY